MTTVHFFLFLFFLLFLLVVVVGSAARWSVRMSIGVSAVSSGNSFSIGISSTAAIRRAVARRGFRSPRSYREICTALTFARSLRSRCVSPCALRATESQVRWVFRSMVDSLQRDDLRSLLFRIACGASLIRRRTTSFGMSSGTLQRRRSQADVSRPVALGPAV